MKKYKTSMKETEEYRYRKEDYIKKGLSYFKFMLFDIYEDNFGKQDISKFKVSIEDTRVTTDGLIFLSNIESKQMFKCTYQGKPAIIGSIKINSSVNNLFSDISIVGQTQPLKYDFNIKLI